MKAFALDPPLDCLAPHLSSTVPSPCVFSSPSKPASLRCRTSYKELTQEFGLPPVKGLWTAEKRLGGWKAIQAEFFEDTVRGWVGPFSRAAGAVVLSFDEPHRLLTNAAAGGRRRLRVPLGACGARPCPSCRGTWTAYARVANLRHLTGSQTVPMGLQGICSEILRDVGARKLAQRLAGR